jgi:transcriptional regulator with XRE-family HTH domain
MPLTREGYLLQTIRHNRDLSVVEAAELLGVDPDAIRDWESGAAQVPDGLLARAAIAWGARSIRGPAGCATVTPPSHEDLLLLRRNYPTSSEPRALQERDGLA